MAALVGAGLLVLAAGLVMAVLARGITSPDWVRARIEARLNEALPGLDASFDQMRLQVAFPGRARVGLRGVRLVTDGGVPVAELSDVSLGLAPRALARGQLALDDVQVTGALVTLVRQPDGRLGLSLGSAFGGGPVPSLTGIIASVDRALAGAQLSGLRRIGAEGLTLRYEDRRAGRGWTLDGGRLRIARERGRLELFADLALLGGGDGVSTVEVTAESVIGSDTIGFGVLLENLPARDIATQSPALAWLEALDAPISGALRSGVEADGTLRRMDATLQIGAGALAPNPATRPIAFDGARTYFSYLPDERLLRFDEIAVQSPLGEVLAEGQARLDAAERGLPGGLWAQMRLSRITMAEGTVVDRDVTVDGAQASFELSLDPFRVTLGSLRVTDPAFPLRASGTLAAKPEGWDLALDAHVARTGAEQVLSLWPRSLKPRTRDWVSEHVRAARLRDTSFALRAAPGGNPKTYFDMRFADADVAYSRDLPPITGGAGRLTIDGRRLALRVDEGKVDAGGGPIDVAGSTFVIPELGDRGGPGIVTLAAAGSATAALAYLDNREWRLLEKVGRSPDMAQGVAEIGGTITLPLRKGVKREDVALDLAGTLRDVESDALVDGRALTARALAIAVDDEAITVEGPVTLSGVAADARWRQPMGGGGSEVEADVTLSPAALDAFGIALPDGMLSGSGQARLSVALRADAPPSFTLDSDLAGLGLDLPQLGWSLRPGTTGRFTISGAAGATPTIDALALRGPGLTAEGTLTLAAGGGLESLALSRLAVGGWLDTEATLVPRGGAMDVALRGGMLDLRRAPFGQGGGAGGGGSGGAGGRFDLAIDRLQVTDTITLDRFTGRAEAVAGGGLRGGFTARVGGKEPVAGELLPQNGGVALRLAGEDAGDILEAAGLLANVQDGSFRLDLAPVAGATGQYDGLLKIEGARLQDTPAAAALLDAISVVGLIDQLNGPGIFFSEVEARFRLTPGGITLSRGSAVGPSMGVSLDGYYNLADGRMDLQGVLSPVYILNGIGRLIARKGEGLIGFNFNLRGTRDAPQVSVNPLSVFTPGMFRDIFRRPPPTLTR
ncbi:AsmA-like C-terminal region-containing protein [Citreimonas salinaria]|uniref:YhdP central domain-containing protein n=1 Tax=Citreimonas salinaria TaxID=321339 RepID=A0A1H3G409_9RHOB|nr:AsmA-like C-terminal region-containing protein [Citreimonas salinaria]SDX97815.1 Protein of unknown function [Citreimonas salinaria]